MLWVLPVPSEPGPPQRDSSASAWKGLSHHLSEPPLHRWWLPGTLLSPSPWNPPSLPLGPAGPGTVSPGSALARPLNCQVCTRHRSFEAREPESLPSTGQCPLNTSFCLHRHPEGLGAAGTKSWKEASLDIRVEHSASFTLY